MCVCICLLDLLMWMVALKIKNLKAIDPEPWAESQRPVLQACAVSSWLAAQVSMTGHLVFFGSQSSPFVKWKGSKKDQMISEIFPTLKVHVFMSFWMRAGLDVALLILLFWVTSAQRPLTWENVPLETLRMLYKGEESADGPWLDCPHFYRTAFSFLENDEQIKLPVINSRE